jgi:hypothetical protein
MTYGPRWNFCWILITGKLPLEGSKRRYGSNRKRRRQGKPKNRSRIPASITRTPS